MLEYRLDLHPNEWREIHADMIAITTRCNLLLI
jgi:hypothetical protein